jgi:nitrate/nitrite transporter NarK
MIDANTKYLAAWGEISARVQAREHVLLLFIAFTAVAVALSLSSEGLLNFSLPIGYVALATAFLSRHHDLVIGNLRRFQHDISRVNPDEKGTPEYTTMGYLGRAIQERSKREYAQVLFIVFGGCASFYPAGKELAAPLSMAAMLWYGSILCSCVAITIVIKTQHDRRDWTK